MYGLTLALALAVPVAPSGNAPPGTREAASAVGSLVAAERAFAADSAARGMNAAFLAFLDADAVLFRPGPVPGVEHLRARPPASGALLWRPDFAEVSAAGDLGVTSGPWEFRPGSGGASSHGHFLTVWRRRPGGAWKVALDIGVDHPADPAATDRVDSPAAPPAPAGGDAGEARASLLAAEREFESAASSGAAAAGFPARAEDDVRLYREGALPVAGKEPARLAIAGQPSRAAWTIAGSGLAASGDLGYVYGTSSASGPPNAAFVRVWRRRPGGPWRIAADVAVPFPAAPGS